MKFDLNKSIELLERTPALLEALLSNLSPDWVMNNEGPDTWSPFDVVGHLIHGEKTDWITRANIILDQQGNRQFKPFDRFAQFDASQGKTMEQLLIEFRPLRAANIESLRAMNIDESKLILEGVHPEFGTVTLEQLLATWVVHDLAHIAQITRVMAHQYADEVGPWKAYIGLLHAK